jgi:hypothetical protein
VQLLPNVLATLQQFKSHPRLRLPLLEFLSVVGRIPALATSLDEMQVKSVFVMALAAIMAATPRTPPASSAPKASSSSSVSGPPTSPAATAAASAGNAAVQYNAQYTVTLAYQVIAVWFYYLHLGRRRAVAAFILEKLRECSGGDDDGTTPSSAMMTCCAEMLWRYTFSDSVEQPGRARTPAVAALLAGGTPRTWAVGHTLVTITASPLGWAEVVIRKATTKVRGSALIDLVCCV